MLRTYNFPEFGSNLIAALTTLNMKDFMHFFFGLVSVHGANGAWLVHVAGPIRKCKKGKRHWAWRGEDKLGRSLLARMHAGVGLAWAL